MICCLLFSFQFENNEQTESSSIHCFRIHKNETKTIVGLSFPVTDKKEPKIGEQ